MTAFEVAEFIGCHEETVRRAYLRGLLSALRSPRTGEREPIAAPNPQKPGGSGAQLLKRARLVGKHHVPLPAAR
jgi:hypothetical protein